MPQRILNMITVNQVMSSLQTVGQFVEFVKVERRRYK